MPKLWKGDAGPGLRLTAVDGAAVAAASPSAEASAGAVTVPRVAVGLFEEGITAMEVAVMADDELRILCALISADLAVIQAEHSARQELVEQQAKRMRRAIVGFMSQRAPGEALTAEAGNQFSYIYPGTPWKLTANSARQRGLTEGLVGRTVCYAWG